MKEYKSMAQSTERGPKSFQFKDGKAEIKGIWEYNHQFTEFGVFYLSIWLCPDDAKAPCDEQRSTHLVSGTGLTDTHGQPLAPGLIPHSAFTVCPQNTFAVPDNAETGMVLNSKLSTCVAQLGYFSPEGPGHIAEKCRQQGFFCGYPGMTWPVAKPGYWVDHYDPTRIEQCKLLGACPGGMGYGVGTDEWRRDGSTVPEQACWGNQTLRFTACSGDRCTEECTNNGGGCADFFAPINPNACFTSTVYISRLHGQSQGGLYDLKQGIVNEQGMIRCRDQVGNRCCPGNKGQGCESCCAEENIPSNVRTAACNARQWYSVDNSEGGSCHVCPEGTTSQYYLYAMLMVLGIIFAPVIAKVSELASYAGAAQAPVLSVVTFLQSVDLFQGLKLNWPPEFRTFCRTIASWASFNFSAILRRLTMVVNGFFSFICFTMLPQWMKDLIPSIPPPACVFHLTYKSKWFFSVLSPAIFLLLVIALVVVHAIAGAARRQLVKLFPKSSRWLGSCCCCCRCRCRFCCRRRRNRDDQEPTADSANVELEASVGTQNSTLVRKVLRPVLIYLLVGNLYLVRSAIEPLVCTKSLSGTSYITAGSGADIPCNLCPQSAEDQMLYGDRDGISYRSLYMWSILFLTLYALGTPLLFMIILTANRSKLHTHSFVQGFGFLCSKMRHEYYWWEVWISFRKMFLVITVMLSVEPETTALFTLISMFVTVCALVAHVWVRPFAHVDANLAESTALLGTILVGFLGVGSGVETEEEQHDLRIVGTMGTYLNYSIYSVVGSCLAISVGVAIKRLVGAWRRYRSSRTLSVMKEYYEAVGGTVPDDVRKMLHKRKVELAVEWISLKSNDTNGSPITSESPGQLTNHERMIKLFESVSKYQKETGRNRRAEFAEWEGYFPQSLRPTMYAWLMRQDPQAQAEADELSWFIDQLEALEKEQHEFLPQCLQQCIAAANDDDPILDTRSNSLVSGADAATLESEFNERQTWVTPVEHSVNGTDRLSKRMKTRMRPVLSDIVYAFKDFFGDSKHLLFGDVLRTSVTFCVLLFSSVFTVYLIVADVVGTRSCREQQRDDPQSGLRHTRSVQDLSGTMYISQYYFQLLVIAPVAMLVYKAGPPLFLAAMESESSEDSVGSMELIELAKAVIQRELAKELVDRDGCGHLMTTERMKVGLTRRQAERLVQFARTQDPASKRELNNAELASLLQFPTHIEFLLILSWVVTTGVIVADYGFGAQGSWLVVLDILYFATLIVYPLAREASKRSLCTGMLTSVGCMNLARRRGHHSADDATRLTELSDVSANSSLSRAIRSTGW